MTLLTTSDKFGHFFTGPREMQVKKKSTGIYNLLFKPTSIVESAECKLTLQNPQTHDLYEYDIVGRVMDPLSKEHIVLNCVAR